MALIDRFKKSLSISIVLLFFSSYINIINAQSRLYLANDDHTDFMWTASDTAYETAFVTMIDAWMANNNASSTNPPDYQTKFDCDGSYWAWAYAKHKTPAEFQNFINQVKSEKMVLPMNPLVITYGCVPAEATIRSMYYAGELQRDYNISLDMALSMENQVMPLGLASIWAGCGAKYSWRGICNCNTNVPGLSGNREKEIYWYKGLDDQGVLMKWYSFNADKTIGGYAEARDPTVAINDLTNKVNTSNYNYNIAAAFGVGMDNLETTTDNLAPAAQSSSNGSKRVIVSNELDFFRDFDSTYGATLPSLTQSYGNEWEDACASLAQVSANVKRSLEKLRSAEAMATIVARTDPAFANTLDSLRKDAWMSLGLYWEHDFVGGSPVISTDERTAWERRMQQNFTDYVDQLYTLAKANLANQINFNSANQRFFVFNPLSWTRTDYTDYAYNGTLPVHVIDVSTNAEVKSQIITTNGTQYLRILAPDVPSEGYKIFEIRSGAGTSYPVAGTVNLSSQIIDNDYFTIAFTNSGVITSFIDKQNGNKELVNSGTSSDYINNMSLNNNFAASDNTNGSFTVVNSGPVNVTVKITSNAAINHETQITVFKDIPRVDIDNSINQNFGDNFLYNTFSFNTANISSPAIWHEENGAVINAKKVSNGGHYADQQARYDWLTLNHFAAVSNNGNYGVTLSNEDCYFMQTGNSTIQSLDENTAKIKVLVGGKVDGLGMSSQGNDAVFNQSYSVSSYKTYSAANSMKRALEHQNGLTCAQITNTSGILPQDNFSFMNISDSNTIVWALKPAEEGMDTRGAIVRVWNLANTASTTNFNFNDNITTAKNVTHIETDVSDATFSGSALNTTIAKNQIKSYRVQITPTSGALPIGIVSFTGVKVNGINKLNWVTDTGIDLVNFNVERSEDGNSYTTFGNVQAKSGITSYTYNDDSLNELKPYYYRLKIFSNSGSFVYSNVILIQVDDNTKNILVYPNPVGSLLKFNLIADKQSRYNVWITDISGQVVMKLSPPLFDKGNNYYTINTGNLPTGTYTLIVSNNEIKYVRKFVKH